MIIDQILKNWSIDVPQDEYFLEYLQNSFAEKFYFIDQCPFKVGEKHAQIDIFFQEENKNQFDMSTFKLLEDKYISVMIKLWLYNEVCVSSNINESIIKRKKNKIDKKNLKLYHLIINGKGFNENDELCEKNILEMYVQLATRDLINAVFYFKNYDILVVPMWGCYAVFFNNLSVKETVEKIINTEGLYLRKYGK